jgi:predicted membrane-bound spermidine synthase
MAQPGSVAGAVLKDSVMSHAEFTRAYADGDVRVDMDHAAAARYLSARLLLPLVMLPVLGLGVGAALLGWLWTGLAVIALAIIVPRLIKRSAATFLLREALQDEHVFQELTRCNILRVSQSA